MFCLKNNFRFLILIKSRLFRCIVILVCLITISIPSVGQDDEDDEEDRDNNNKPKIKGQRDLSTDEEEPITIELTDLEVEDKDDWFYPIGFTLKLYDGENYSRSGQTITPDRDFDGTLTVPVTVNDGEDNSDKFELEIKVKNANDRPQIKGQNSLSVAEDNPFMFDEEHFDIDDPDDNNFAIIVSEGTNYTFNGQTVIPAKDFNGLLTIPVKADDGDGRSSSYDALLNVTPVNDPPLITGQQALNGKGNVAFPLALSYLTVTDPDNTFPTGFSLKILSGQNYAVNGFEITPNITFVGELAVAIQVNDGMSDSEIFNLKVAVEKGDTKPVITNQAPVIINEEGSYTITLDNLVVNNGEGNYPNGFTLNMLPGENYDISNGSTIKPVTNYFGNLAIPVSVSHGNQTSNNFNFMITVRPVNDAPVISLVDTTEIVFAPGDMPKKIFPKLSVTDVDNDSISLAEISLGAGYVKGSDMLIFTARAGSPIKGVFDSQNGILALIGKGSLTQYEGAISSISYQLTTDPGKDRNNIVVLVNVSDGQTNSNREQRVIAFKKTAGEIDGLLIPTAFTPNGDFVNDTWGIRADEALGKFENAVIRVYTKSGLLVFESSGHNREWDGHLNGVMLPADVYFYTIEVDRNDPSSAVKGAVSILR